MSTTNKTVDVSIVTISSQLLRENAQEIHRWILMSVAIFALVFSSVSLYIGDTTQAWISLLIVPGTIISYFVQRAGYFYEAKLFNIIQISILLGGISLFTGINSLAFLYFIPVIISTLLVFQNKERNTGYALTAFILLILVGLTLIAETMGNSFWNLEHQVQDRTAHIIGAIVCCFLILLFVIKLLSKEQDQLVESSKALSFDNDKLMAASNSRNQLMSVLAHDLRAPMAGAIMTVEACSNDSTSEESKKEMLKILHTKASQILAMTDQLLEWSRSQTGHLDCKMDLIPAEHFFTYVTDWTKTIGESKNIQFKIDFTFNKDQEVCCDQNMIETILRNLISNAVKFSSEGKTIIVRSGNTNGKRFFEVVDFGKGMNAEQIQKLNDGVSFTTNGTNKEKGNGFGLQLVQEFLRRHESKLEINSTVGVGSSFKFEL